MFQAFQAAMSSETPSEVVLSAVSLRAWQTCEILKNPAINGREMIIFGNEIALHLLLMLL